MPSVSDIRRRIRSVQNTGKVTNAMSLIAASKMRRAQNSVVQGRPYAVKIHEIIADLAAQPQGEDGVGHPLLEVRPVRRVGLLAITPDRGLAGGMHATVNRQVAQRSRHRPRRHRRADRFRRRCKPSGSRQQGQRRP